MNSEALLARAPTADAIEQPPAAPPCGPDSAEVGVGVGVRAEVGVEVDVAEAEDFLGLLHAEHPDQPLTVRQRMRQVRAEVADTGSYAHTADELAFGARVAWRNSSRCIGRLYWQSLRVLDRRDATTPREIHRHLCEHLRQATNGGRIRPTISVFAPDRPGRPAPRLWNDQLIRYAGYRGDDGRTVGD
ncbi:nitric oxide synthase oxygenase, partial [Streptomyces sp. NPDC003860]